MALTAAQRAKRFRQRHETQRQRVIRGLLEEIAFLQGCLRDVRKYPADYLDKYEDEEFEVFMARTDAMVKGLRVGMNRAFSPSGGDRVGASAP